MCARIYYNNNKNTSPDLDGFSLLLKTNHSHIHFPFFVNEQEAESPIPSHFFVVVANDREEGESQRKQNEVDLK